MCSVKTVESVPYVWRIWYREKPSPGWLASVSTIRGNKFSWCICITIKYSQTQLKKEGEKCKLMQVRLKTWKETEDKNENQFTLCSNEKKTILCVSVL